MKRLLRRVGLASIGARALGAYLRFALRTTRWQVIGAGEVSGFVAGQPAIFAFWHEQLAIMPAMWAMAARGRRRQGLPARRMHVLVSRHRDGRLIGQVIGAFGLATIHGSSAKGAAQKGGSAALRAMAAALARGDQVAVTPDGPRGPRRRAAAGVTQLAALAGVPVIACGGACRWGRTLPTWDRMRLPLPFGRGALVFGSAMLIDRAGWERGLPALEQAMNQAAAQAEAACRA